MTIKTNTIAEYTSGEGVTIDGLLIKDGGIPQAVVTAHQGAVDHGSVAGLYDDDHVQYLLATGGRVGSSAAAQDFGATGIKANVIAESSAAAGVTVDGVLLKDGLVDGVNMADLADFASLSPSSGQMVGYTSAWQMVTPSAAPGAVADVVLKTGAGGKLQLAQLGIGVDPASGVSLHVLGGTGLVLVSTSITDATNKTARFGCGHYTNAEEHVTGLVINSTSTASLINIGGASSVSNAATAIALYAAADTTTVTGTRKVIVDVNGVAIGDALPTSSVAQLLIVPSDVAKAALQLRSIAGQTDPLLEISNSSGTPRLSIYEQGIINYAGTMGNSAKTVGTDAPVDWIECQIAGTVRYIPVYAA